MKDFLGNQIEAGDKIAYAKTYGSSGACLTVRYVLEVHERYVKVSPEPKVPSDQRIIGRIWRTHQTTQIMEKGSFEV